MTSTQICDYLEGLQAQGIPLDELLTRAMEKLHETHSSFDWTGIYELFPDQCLRLGPYVGEATDHVFIAVGRGVCGTAVSEKRNLNIPDVSALSNYLACSASTKSELVVLIRRGETIYGQIDIDSHTLNAFDNDVVELVQSVADCLAQAYEQNPQKAQTEQESELLGSPVNA